MRVPSLIVCFLGIILFNGCKKKNGDTPDPVPHTITLQPNSSNGQDTYVAKIDNEPTDGNANLDNINELVMARWKAAGNPNNATWRSFLKFTQLDTIPSNANVTSAILYLFGKSSSTSFPNGNSSYPGSSLEDNSSLIQRVTGGDWSETSLTWNTMPSSTDVGQATIPASTSMWDYNVVVDVTTMVKEMVANPNANYGFSIRLSDETPSRSLIFATSEATDPSLRPKLVVVAEY